MQRFSFVFFLIFCAFHFCKAQDRVTGHNFATRSEIDARYGMAATSVPLATQVALDILKKGGSAVDAAIAANAMQGLTEPGSCGIGGDLFAIVWDAKSQKLYGLNASGRSPKSLTLDYYRKQGITQIPSKGPLPVSVPGCVDGWFELHKKFGKLPMSEILAPSISYARRGFPFTEFVATTVKSGLEGDVSENFKATYMMPDGTMPEKGKIFKNPHLADVYEKIATKGRDEFYKGSVARTIDAYMKRIGGFLSYDDMASHKSEWVEPVSTNYRGYDVWELPPNGQGISALQILNILEQYDIKSLGFGSTEYMHLFLEAKKLVFEDRARYYADMNFSNVPVAKLISKEYAKERAKLIDPDRAASRYSGGLGGPNTIYLTVADKDGNMVSLIQSNYWNMGSKVVPDNLGFVLQNRGESFSLDEKHPNVFAPGKRPFHTIIPAFITKDGKPWVSFGVMGGDMQPQGHVQVVVNLIDFGMNLQEAGDAPRMQHVGSSTQTSSTIMTDGGNVYLESGFQYQQIRNLVQKGHKVGFDVGNFGGYQAIMWDDVNKVYFGASESRKDGQAAGY